MNDLGIFEKIITVNFLGCMYCTFHSLHYLKEFKGRLAGISSLRGKFPSATADGYGASKHAMSEFFSSLRIELADTGVSVTVIYHGWFSTGISSRALGADGLPAGKISLNETGAMSLESCTEIILKAVSNRKCEVIMTMEGKIGLWLKLIAPKTLDCIIKKKDSIILGSRFLYWKNGIGIPACLKKHIYQSLIIA